MKMMAAIVVLLLLAVIGLVAHRTQPSWQAWWILREVRKERMAGKSFFRIQEQAVMASVAREIKTKLQLSRYKPRTGVVRVWESDYMARAFYYTYEEPFQEPEEKIRNRLSVDHNVDLRWENSRYEAYNKRSGKNLDIYERKDWKTINVLVWKCNEWMKAKGRLACEFDGGIDYGMKPYTAFLFNTAYLKYLSLNLGYGDGQYRLVEDDKPAVALDPDSLLSRNAIARFICYQLLVQTCYLMAEKDVTIGRQPEADKWGWELMSNKELLRDYQNGRYRWREYLKKCHKINIAWSETGLEFTNRKTNEKILFARDDDLINEALEKLNYYKEKLDFTSHFMKENHPMFLLSILLLYDVNLQLDEASGKYIIAPGPHDPKRFFEIVSEFTFVTDQSDIEYLKKHLNRWADFHTEPAEPPIAAWPAAPG